MLGTKGMNLILKNDKDPKIGNLWLGSYDAIRNAEQLKSNNITCVVSVVDAISVRLPEDLWIEQKTFQAVDDNKHNIAPILEETYKMIDNGMAKGNVLVHCAAGISRSTTVVIAYMIKKHKMTFQAAFDYVKERRPIAFPNLGFRDQLHKYELEQLKQ